MSFEFDGKSALLHDELAVGGGSKRDSACMRNEAGSNATTPHDIGGSNSEGQHMPSTVGAAPATQLTVDESVDGEGTAEASLPYQDATTIELAWLRTELDRAKKEAFAAVQAAKAEASALKCKFNKIKRANADLKNDKMRLEDRLFSVLEIQKETPPGVQTKSRKGSLSISGLLRWKFPAVCAAGAIAITLTMLSRRK